MSTIVIFFAFAIAMYALYRIYKEMHDAKDYRFNEQVKPKGDAPTVMENKKNFNTRALVLRTLKNIGCQEIEEEERISFSFQNENFVIEAADDCQFINVLDPWWYASPIDDIENLSRIRKAVNQVNLLNPYPVVYSFNEEKRIIGVHTKHNMLFNAQIEGLEDYLIATLNNFFSIQRDFLTEIEKEKVWEESKS